jgi:hemolysin activation/secretion protein
LDINSRSSISIKNKIGYLNSDTFINNELFRIGGVNTIRGFNEQSIITNDYNIFKIEFRYLTSEKTYFYTITDAGRIKLDSKNKNLLGLGLGYLFTTKKARVNISLAKSNQNTDLKEINFTVKWTNFF